MSSPHILNVANRLKHMKIKIKITFNYGLECIANEVVFDISENKIYAYYDHATHYYDMDVIKTISFIKS